MGWTILLRKQRVTLCRAAYFPVSLWQWCNNIPFQVADQYAFIPREAISKFLLFCIDCQRKNSIDHRGGNNSNNSRANNIKSSGDGSVTSDRSSSADSPSVMDVGGVGKGSADMQGM